MPQLLNDTISVHICKETRLLIDGSIRFTEMKDVK